MTLDHFERLVQEYQPKFNLRYKGYSDVVGCFIGFHYLGYRISKGELHADSFYLADQDDEGAKLMRRGRSQILKLLVRRHLLTQEQASRIMYGIAKD